MFFMCQCVEIGSLKRSSDTSGMGKQALMTHINVVSGRCEDKSRERKRRGPRGARTAWFYQYLAKGLHKDENKL